MNKYYIIFFLCNIINLYGKGKSNDIDINNYQLNCLPPQPGLPYEYVYDLSLKPKIGWGIEWWYYVLNLNADMQFYPSISITTFVIRNPLTGCDNLNNQMFNFYIGITSSIFDDIEYTDTIFYDLNNTKNNEHLNITQGDFSFIRYMEHNFTKIKYGNNEILMKDGRGYYLQGENGFTRTGPNDYDNYYTGSFMRLKVTGILENGMLINGVGYGEHVFGSPNSNDTNTIYKGWHCHYIHNSPCIHNITCHNENDMKNYKDLQYCDSIRKDGLQDMYSRGIYVNENEELFYLKPNDILFTYTDNWDSQFPLNWTYDFINPNITLPSLNMYPIQDVINQTHTFDNITWWDGGVSTKDSEYFGILELVNFNN